MVIETLATFVAPAVNMIATGDELKDKQKGAGLLRKIEIIFHSEKLHEEFPRVDAKLKFIRTEDCVFEVVASRNKMNFFSRYFFVQQAETLGKAYCLGGWMDASDIVERKDLSGIISEQACRFVIIGKKDGILDFVKKYYKGDAINEEFGKYYTQEI